MLEWYNKLKAIEDTFKTLTRYTYQLILGLDPLDSAFYFCLLFLLKNIYLLSAKKNLKQNKHKIK